MHILGAWRVHFGSLVSWSPFWELWGLLGHLFGGLGRLRLHFGGSGGPLGLVLAPLGPLGSIFGALGVPWAPFWGLSGSLGLHFGSSGGLMGAFGGPGGRPWPPKGPKANFFQFFPSYFGVILASFWE